MGAMSLSSPGDQEACTAGEWRVGGLSRPRKGGARGTPDLPSHRQPRVRTRGYLPARGSGGHPRSCGWCAAPGLRAPSQAAAGRAPRGLRLVPPNFPSPSVGRGGSGGGQAGRNEARPAEPQPALAGAGRCAPQPQRAARLPAPRARRAPRPPAEGRTRPGRQSPRPPPASPSPRPSRRGGGGLGFKDTLTQAASGLASQSSGLGAERERLAPPSPSPLPLSARPPRAGRKSLGRERLPEKPVPLPLSLVRLLLEDAQTLHAASLAGKRSECSRRHTPSQTPAHPGDLRAGASLARLCCLKPGRQCLGGTPMSIGEPE